MTMSTTLIGNYRQILIIMKKTNGDLLLLPGLLQIHGGHIHGHISLKMDKKHMRLRCFWLSREGNSHTSLFV